MDAIVLIFALVAAGFYVGGVPGGLLMIVLTIYSVYSWHR